MYYELKNVIGTEIVVNDTTLVCGELYENKIKAPKDVAYILAFTDSKTVNSAGKKLWRFDGKADLDYTKFVDEVEANKVYQLAWKSEKINIQALIRPTKNTKKAEQNIINATDFAILDAERESGTIDIQEFVKRTQQIYAR